MSLATITSEQFYATFEKLSDRAKLVFMLQAKSQGYSYKLDSQPDAIPWRFYESYIDAHLVVSTFVECFGPNPICRESTYTKGHPQTILDILYLELQHAEMNRHNIKRIEKIQEIINSMYQHGARCADDLDTLYLTNEYLRDPVYAEDFVETLMQKK